MGLNNTVFPKVVRIYLYFFNREDTYIRLLVHDIRLPVPLQARPAAVQ